MWAGLPSHKPWPDNDNPGLRLPNIRTTIAPILTHTLLFLTSNLSCFNLSRMCRKGAEIMPLEPIYLVSFLTVSCPWENEIYLRSDPTRMSVFSTDLWHEHDVLDQLLTSGMSPSLSDHPVVDRKTDSCRCWRRLRATVIVIRSGASTATSLASRPAVVGAGGDGAFADSSQQPQLMSPFLLCPDASTIAHACTCTRFRARRCSLHFAAPVSFSAG
jgi:hypothetical protein